MKKQRQEPLEKLYQRLRSRRLSADAHDEILGTIRFRSNLASASYRLQALDLTQAELEDRIAQLSVAIEDDPAPQDLAEAVRREVAGAQLAVVTAEYQRRQAVYTAANKGDLYLPSRTDLLGALTGLATQLLDDPENAHFSATTSAILDLARRHASQGKPGIPIVVEVLREADRLPPERITHQLDPWVRWAVALEFLASEQGFAGQRVDADPVTRAEANRAKRLLYATDRQDPRYDEADWPLDLTGTTIAEVLEEYAKAAERWANNRIPERDLVFYLSPIRKEEGGRPAPHPQIVPEKVVRELAVQAGAFPVPFVYAIPPDERLRVTRQIWSHGLPPIPSNLPGLLFYDVGGDPRIRWGAPPYPYGLLCGIIVKPEEVLHVPHPDHPQDFDRFNELTRRADLEARRGRPYPETLRSILRSEGVRAVAHYHPTKHYLHELVVLDSGPETVLVIRESFPPFMRNDRALVLPHRDRRNPTLASLP